MRKILLFLIVIMVTLTVGAQKILEGTKPSLKGVNKISLKIDFSETKIDNKTVADWLEYRQASQPKYNAKNELENELKPVVQEKVIKSLNDKLSKKGAFVTLNSNAKSVTTLVCITFPRRKRGVDDQESRETRLIWQTSTSHAWKNCTLMDWTERRTPSRLMPRL